MHGSSAGPARPCQTQQRAKTRESLQHRPAVALQAGTSPVSRLLSGSAIIIVLRRSSGATEPRLRAPATPPAISLRASRHHASHRWLGAISQALPALSAGSAEPVDEACSPGRGFDVCSGIPRRPRLGVVAALWRRTCARAAWEGSCTGDTRCLRPSLHCTTQQYGSVRGAHWTGVLHRAYVLSTCGLATSNRCTSGPVYPAVQDVIVIDLQHGASCQRMRKCLCWTAAAAVSQVCVC